MPMSDSVDRKRPVEPGPERGSPLRSMMTLALSLGALAFLAWMIAVHPDHQSLYGPAPSAAALAVASVHPAPPHGADPSRG